MPATADGTTGDVEFTEASCEKIMRPNQGMYDATDPDLRAFRAAGSKLILWHGLGDQHIPAGQVRGRGEPRTEVARFVPLRVRDRRQLGRRPVGGHQGQGLTDEVTGTADPGHGPGAARVWRTRRAAGHGPDARARRGVRGARRGVRHGPGRACRRGFAPGPATPPPGQSVRLG
ncbi:hypothetical protein GCM10023335_07980 [Streptomyces siamensis]|uniref:Uncharacterized protein n=1 Tax=Streptomyces siamensis TaxID=1274986 RepID=A0ABP9IG97_9ACTN